MSKVRPRELGVSGDEDEQHNMLVSHSAGIYHTLVAKPWRWFSFALCGHILAIIITLILWGANYNIFPTQFGITPITPSQQGSGNGIFRHDLAWRAVSVDATNNLWSQKLPTQAPRSNEAMPLELIFTSASNCLTKVNLRAMLQLETALLNNSDYATRICQLQPDGRCRKPRSVLRFFDGSYMGYNLLDSNSQNIFRSDLNFDRIPEIITTAYDANGKSDRSNAIAAGQPDLQTLLNYVVGIDFNNFFVTSSVCRAMLYSGLPLAGFRTEEDNTAAQLSNLGDLHWNTLDSFLKARTALGDMKMYYHSDGLEAHAESAQRVLDYYLGIGSILFLFVALWIQTRSAWIAFFSMVGSLGSFVWANLLYRIILNFYSFADPQGLAAYIVALLGAFHTVYILHLYQQTKAIKSLQPLTEEARWGTTMKTGHRVIFSVTAVLALAFFVSAASSFVVVMNYSVFCALLCITTYLSTMLFIPSVIATWSDHWAHVHLVDWSGFWRRGAHHQQKGSIFRSAQLTSPSSTGTPNKKSNPNALLRFFRGTYVDLFLAHPMLRWLLISASVIIVAAFLIAACIRLRVDRNQPVLWRSATNMGTWRNLQNKNFGQSDQDTSVRMYLLWGLEDLDYSGCHRSDFGCTPSPVYNEAFDMSFHTMQKGLLNFCKQLKNMDSATERALFVRRSGTVDSQTGENPLEIKCFPLAQQAFLNSSGSRAAPLPFDLSDLSSLVQNNPSLYPAGVYSSVGGVNSPKDGTYYRPYEMAALHWLTNGSLSAYPSPDYVKYSQFLGGSADSTLRRSTNGNSVSFAGYFGDTLRYVVVTANLTLITVNQDLSAVTAAKAAWEAYMAKIVPSLPTPLQTVYISTPETQAFAWAAVQGDLFTSLCRGIALSLMFLFLGVTMATGNWLLALLATVTGLWVVFMIMGIMAFSGWSLGVVESVLFVMVVPLTSIFTITLSVAFQRAASPSRRERLRMALVECAPVAFFVSVAGLGYAVFLYGAELQFIFEYGVVLFATTGLGGVFSLVFMAAVLGVSGPRDRIGRLWDGPTSTPAPAALHLAPLSSAAITTGTSVSGSSTTGYTAVGPSANTTTAATATLTTSSTVPAASSLNPASAPASEGALPLDGSMVAAAAFFANMSTTNAGADRQGDTPAAASKA